MVGRLKKEKNDIGRKLIVVLNVFGSLALDMVISYHFEILYQDVEELIMSATKFVNIFVAVSSFFDLLKALSQVGEHMAAILDKKKLHNLKSIDLVARFAANAIDSVSTQEKISEATFQAS